MGIRRGREREGKKSTDQGPFIPHCPISKAAACITVKAVFLIQNGPRTRAVRSVSMAKWESFLFYSRRGVSPGLAVSSYGERTVKRHMPGLAETIPAISREQINGGEKAPVPLGTSAGTR